MSLELLGRLQLRLRGHRRVEQLAGRAGKPPTSPAATSAFWLLMAATTSLGMSGTPASRCGLSQMRIAWGEPNTLTSPTPSTRDSGSWMFESGNRRRPGNRACRSCRRPRPAAAVRVRLGHAHALRLHFGRQARDRRCDLVLDLHLGDVGIGALVERDGDVRLAARARLELK